MELLRHIARTSVNMQAATPRMREIAPPVEQQLNDNDFEVTFTVDVSGILATLRELPDGAGTDIFVAAYNARFDAARAGDA